MATTLAITGAAGRMGCRLVALASADPQLKVVAAVERADSAMIDRDAGEIAGIGHIGVAISSDLRAHADVVIDFTAPTAMRHWLKVCHDRRLALVVGTTGLHAPDHAAIDIAAAHIPILQAANMSLGVNLMLRLVADVAARLGDAYDIEIVETHHRNKKDAPSGTALALADSILAATHKTRDALTHGRHGDDTTRKPGTIGMHAVRMGDEIGKHVVTFAATGERIELTHAASTRDTFALGALRAAKWLAGKTPGRYSMADVLGL